MLTSQTKRRTTVGPLVRSERFVGTNLPNLPDIIGPGTYHVEQHDTFINDLNNRYCNRFGAGFGNQTGPRFSKYKRLRTTTKPDSDEEAAGGGGGGGADDGELISTRRSYSKNVKKSPKIKPAYKPFNIGKDFIDTSEKQQRADYRSFVDMIQNPGNPPPGTYEHDSVTNRHARFYKDSDYKVFNVGKQRLWQSSGTELTAIGVDMEQVKCAICKHFKPPDNTLPKPDKPYPEYYVNYNGKILLCKQCFGFVLRWGQYLPREYAQSFIKVNVKPAKEDTTVKSKKKDLDREEFERQLREEKERVEREKRELRQRYLQSLDSEQRVKFNRRVQYLSCYWA